MAKYRVIEIWQHEPVITEHRYIDDAKARYIIAEEWLENLRVPNRLIAVFLYGSDGDLLDCRSWKGEL